MSRIRIRKALKHCLLGCSEAGCEYSDKAICNGIECKTCAELLLEDALDEMKIAQWIAGGQYKGTYKCSECGLSVITHKTMEWDYCPRCGAYMSGVIRNGLHQTEGPDPETEAGDQ